MTEHVSNVPVDALQFDSYWPAGSPELVRAFLKTQYDPETMPPLHASFRDGSYWLIGWQPPEGCPGLLEAARGWGLTQDEEEWVRASEELESSFRYRQQRLDVMRRMGRRPK